MSNFLEDVFRPSYSFDTISGFQTTLDTSLNGNVTIGNLNTNYTLLLNGLPLANGNDTSNWAFYTANNAVNLGGNNLSNIGSLFDSTTSSGNPGEILSSTGTGTQWIAVNTSNWASYPANNAVDVGGNNLSNIGSLFDSTTSSGTPGQILSSTGTGTQWISSPSAPIRGYWSYQMSTDQIINENGTAGAGTYIQWNTIVFESTFAINTTGSLPNTEWTAPYDGWYNITLNFEGRTYNDPVAEGGSKIIAYNFNAPGALTPPVHFIRDIGGPISSLYSSSITYMEKLNAGDRIVFMGGVGDPGVQSELNGSSKLNIQLIEAL
jgi:hypothetical protein